MLDERDHRRPGAAGTWTVRLVNVRAQRASSVSTGLGRPHAGALTHAGGKGRQPPMRPQAAPGPPHHHQPPQERAHRLRTGLSVSHVRVVRAAWHCERAGAQERGHTTRQDTLDDQDTCRVCSPAGRRNVCVERAVCVRRTPARGGGGQGCAGGGGPIYSRPGLVYFCGGTGVAGGSVGGHEVPAAGSSPLICGRGRAPAGWLGLCGPGVPS